MPATTPLLKEGRYSIEQEFTGPDNSLRFQVFDTVEEIALTIVEVTPNLPRVATAAQREAFNKEFVELANQLMTFNGKAAVAIRDHFSEAGRHYLVTDLVDGLDLESVLTGEGKPAKFADVAVWSDDLLETLNQLHLSRPPRYFGALRPSSMILHADRSVGLLMSASVSWGERDVPEEAVAFCPLEQLWSGLDAASQKVIISKYDEASEKILKQPVDARSDIYALGATLYYLLTGKRPTDALERSIEMIEGNPDPLKAPHRIDPAIPTEISDVVMKAMELRREYRFDSAAIMRQVMKTALVRVKEREEEEEQDHREAAQDLKLAAEARRVEESRPTETGQAAPATPAPEPTKPLFEQADPAPANSDAGRVTQAFTLADLDDDLLGLLSPTPHTSEAPQPKPTVEAKPIDVAARAETEPTLSETTLHGFESVVADETFEPTPEPVESFESVADTEDSGQVEAAAEAFEPTVEPEREPEPKIALPVKDNVVAMPVAAASTVTEFAAHDSDPSPSKLPLPALAAAAAVLIVAVVGGWFLLGSGSGNSSAQQPPVQSASQTQNESPAQTAAQPEAERNSYQGQQPVVDQAATDPASTSPATTGDQDHQGQKVAATAPNKPKKPAPGPTKAPAQKKAVTVDDLINDN